MAWTVRDLMQGDVRTISPDTTLVELERSFLEQRVTGFPVVDEGRLVGMVSRSDVVRQLSVEQSVGELLSDYYRDIGVGPGDGKPAESLRAISRHVGARMETLRVRDLMIPGLITIAPDTPLPAAARMLLEQRIHRLPVVEDGALVGIVTSLDFVRLFADERVQVG